MLPRLSEHHPGLMEFDFQVLQPPDWDRGLAENMKTYSDFIQQKGGNFTETSKVGAEEIGIQHCGGMVQYDIHPWTSFRRDQVVKPGKLFARVCLL